MATKLDLADAQFVGFAHGKWNHSDILGLIDGMGLTKAEWEKWKKEYPTHSLTDSEINEIDDHFKKEQNHIADTGKMIATSASLE